MGKKKRLMEKKKIFMGTEGRESCSWTPAGNGTIDRCIATWKAMGHDVNRSVSYVPGCPFVILPVKQMYELHWNTDIWYAMDRIEFVLLKINTEAKKHGEEYVFKEIVKIMSSTSRRLYSLITFNVREARTCVVKTVDAFMFEDKMPGHSEPDKYDLRDWRFKSGCPEVPFEVMDEISSEEECPSPQFSYESSDSD